MSEHEEYDILTICIEDFEGEVEQRKSDALADDVWIADAKAQLAFAEMMTDDEWRFLRDLIVDHLWKSCNLGEAFRDARVWALEQIQQARAEDGQAAASSEPPKSQEGATRQ